MANYGLTVIAPGENPKVDIVFVHGLRADMTKTWTKNGILWPAQLLPKDVPEARIFLFGYDTAIVRIKPGNVSKTEVHSNADDLCAKLAAERSNSPEAANRPIVIIAHSLGGLVAAQLFIHGEQSSDDSSAKAIVKNIRGMIFLGTPFRGSVAAGPAENVRRILQLMGADTQEDTLKNLGMNSEKANELTRSFSNLLIKRKRSNDQIHAFFFYETLATQIAKWKYVQVVENDSAQLPGCGDAIPIRTDHHDICKFASEKEEGYGLIVAAIRKSLESPEEDSQDSQSGGTWIYNYGKAVNVGNIRFDGNQSNTIS
ncbi:Alpha/Beta hydrolase protein [Xylaria longipes]|nr:Alpha/Beta hydrolase protein [Xylaria longipes]